MLEIDEPLSMLFSVLGLLTSQCGDRPSPAYQFTLVGMLSPLWCESGSSIPEPLCNGQSSDFARALLQRLQSLRIVLVASVGLQL